MLLYGKQCSQLQGAGPSHSPNKAAGQCEALVPDLAQLKGMHVLQAAAWSRLSLVTLRQRVSVTDMSADSCGQFAGRQEPGRAVCAQHVMLTKLTLGLPVPTVRWSLAQLLSRHACLAGSCREQIPGISQRGSRPAWKKLRRLLTPRTTWALPPCSWLHLQ